MTQHSRSEIGLLLLAGVGAGTLIGIAVGVLLGRRAFSADGDTRDETVGALKEDAWKALSELSESVDALVGKSRDLLHKKH